jgi:hypothetical protein
MKWFFRGLILLLLIGGWIVAARAVHVVRATNPDTGQDRFGIVPKARWQFQDSYVDARGWTAADLSVHEAFVRHLCRSPKADLLNHIIPKEDRKDPAAWLIRTLENPPATTPATPPATNPG